MQYSYVPYQVIEVKKGNDLLKSTKLVSSMDRTKYVFIFTPRYDLSFSQTACQAPISSRYNEYHFCCIAANINRQKCNILLMETLLRLEDNYEDTFHSSSTSTLISNHLKLLPLCSLFEHFALPLVSVQGDLAKAYGVGGAWLISGIWRCGSLTLVICSILFLPAPLTHHLV